MRIAIYISDLTENTSDLMPWRMVLEIAARLERRGCQTVVLSGQRGVPVREWKNHQVRLMDVPKPDDIGAMQQLKAVCRKEKIELLYWPLAWWRPPTNVAVLQKEGLRIVWYVPGAWYKSGQVLRASLSLGIKGVLPYLAQALSLKRRYMRKLTQKSMQPLITMTNYSRETIIRFGYPAESINVIPPGKSRLQQDNGEHIVFNRVQEMLAGSPYFLYFGPPQLIRGVKQMLAAFEQVVKKYQDVRLVCLFRADKDLQPDKLRSRIERMGLGDRLICIWKSVNSTDLDAFLRSCYAVLKPFLLVPSEIPLAVIEAAGYGKPVISTGPSGTGLFVRQFGLIVPPGNAKALSAAMLCLVKDEVL